MNRTIKVKLDLKEVEFNALRTTQSVASEIFNDHVEWSFENKTFSKAKAHVDLYKVERTKFPAFPSAMLQTIRDTALETIKALKFKFKPRKSANSGIRYDKRLFALRGEQLTFSSINGRIKTIVSFPDWCKDIVNDGKLKCLQLSFDKQHEQFYANFVFEIKDVKLKVEGKTIGLDRGIINLITTSEGVNYSSKKLRKSQRKFLFLRRTLSAKGTRSAKLLLKKLSGKEKRFSREINHIIAKELASDTTVMTYVIEDLSGIRNKRRGKKFNKRLSSWPFYQLELILTYKCEASGIKVVKVDPRYTSQRCSCCGNIDKNSRKGGKYCCTKCGFKCHADTNAAINIRDLYVKHSQRSYVEQAAVNQPMVRKSEMPHFCSSQGHPLVG